MFLLFGMTVSSSFASSSSSRRHWVGPLVDPFRCHTSRVPSTVFPGSFRLLVQQLEVTILPLGSWPVRRKF